MDEAASALRLQQESKPDDITELDHKIMTLQIELESLRNESDIASRERREKLEVTLKESQEEAAVLTEKWEKERAEIDAIKKTKEDLEKARVELDQAQRENNFGRAGELRYSIIPSLEGKLPEEGETTTSGDGSLIHDSVTADDISAVVSRVTGSKYPFLIWGQMKVGEMAFSSVKIHIWKPSSSIPVAEL
jgi:ATP-dependent Clp protease ATP-binding subunit ClpB